MEYSLVRSKRKTMAIYITKEAKVEVRVPTTLPKAEIDKFVESKEKWIREHLAVRRNLIKQKTDFMLRYGDRVLYRGKEYAICGKDEPHLGFDDAVLYLPKNLTSEQIKYAVIQRYKILAKRDLTRKVMDFAALMQVKPSAVKINSAKTRWGSCSGKNRINFSWQLILCDDAVIDYVVVHELAHIKEHNHSPQFWQVVEEVFPDYKERQKGLKVVHQRLLEENWE